MGFSTPFILRPVATTLLAIAIFVTGCVAYRFLPVAALPSVDIPAIVVFANRPGADPATMANSIAAPLERRLGEIAGVTNMSSISSLGATTIVVLFDIDRSITGAAHDVQAAINAAASDLPADLPQAPFFKKYNPADSPILTIALTSDTRTIAEIYDAADSFLGQRLSQVPGVGQVQVNGAEKPAVRISLDPVRLAAAGLSGQDVYNVVRQANVTQPTGSFSGPERASVIGINGQISIAAQYRKLVLKSANGGFVTLDSVATLKDGVANTRLAATFGHEPAILLTVTKQAGANVIETVDAIRAMLPQLQKWLPTGVRMTVISDRTSTIRASVDDVQYTLLITVALVLMVVVLFMRRVVSTAAAAVTLPLSLAGTLAGMYLLGYSLDNFSLMALTIGVGFVVDDAIVMIENIVRHMEMGQAPLAAALNGARQIGFTVFSISVSLVAVFIPILFLPGLMGRLFHEFAMTLTMAIVISAAVSLTLTPMLMARFAAPSTTSPSTTSPPRAALRRLDAGIERVLNAVQAGYIRTLGWALRHRRLMVTLMFASIAGTVWLYGAVPKGFLPIQDTGLLRGFTLAAPNVSFEEMSKLESQVVDIVLADPAVATVGSRIGVAAGWTTLNSGYMTIQLKPRGVRGVSSEQVIARLRKPLARVLGIQTFLASEQDLRTGGHQSNAQFDFVLRDENLTELRHWSQVVEDRLRTVPGIEDVSSDQDHAAPQANVIIDRAAAARLGVNVSAIDNALNNAYAQRQISRIYTDRNQYEVVLEIDPRLQASPSQLDRLYVGATNVNGTAAPASSSRAVLKNPTGAVTLGSATGGSQIGGTQVPLLAMAHTEMGTAALSVRHEGTFPAATISFNIKPGLALGDAEAAVTAAARALGMPDSVHYGFGGNAKLLGKSLDSEPILILAALLSIYIVLGVLYESLIQPLTILSTLPSAGLGALLALLLTGTNLDIMGIIGIVLLMGIVKKNGIMLVDFALEAERLRGLDAEAAIREACIERFRPIVMTTLAALLGALPLALAIGTGAELRRPLGISIVGGLIVSQALTLYTTPAIYLALENLSRRGRARPAIAAAE